MDVIIDTNIIIQENFLRSNKSAALLDYLKKTNSKIALPQIVKEESISEYEKSVALQLDKATKEIEKLSKICFFSVVSLDLNVEVIEESTAYIGYIQKLGKDGLLYEIPYEDSFLHEVVFRMINRKKPCNEKGEECRDAILWLSMKDMLKREKSAAFISSNSKEFASLDKTDLHPDLRAELTQEKLELKYYLNLDDFIKNHASKVEYITEEWIEKELSRLELKELIAEYLPYSDTFIKYIERNTYDECIDVDIHSVSTNICDFYVYEMTNEDVYLGLTISTDIHFEAEFEKSGTMIHEVRAFLELSAKVITKEIKELDLEKGNWKFPEKSRSLFDF